MMLLRIESEVTESSTIALKPIEDYPVRTSKMIPWFLVELVDCRHHTIRNSKPGSSDAGAKPEPTALSINYLTLNQGEKQCVWVATQLTGAVFYFTLYSLHLSYVNLVPLVRREVQGFE